MIISTPLLAFIFLRGSFASEQRPLLSNTEIARNRSNPLTEEFGDYVNSLLEDWKVPGLSIAVIDEDEVYTEGYGFAILPDTPVTPETLFLGGSTTKAYLAATLAELIATGDHDSAFPLGWSTPISSIIRDDFVLADEWATAHITLEDAASHRTGMPRHDTSWRRTRTPKDDESQGTTNEEIVRNLRNLQPTAQPRVTFQYCNLMYVTLSHVVETITGSWLGDVLRNIIWAPLGMTSTYLSYHDARKGGHSIATGYFWDDDKQEYVGVEEDPVQLSSGAGGIISNVVDYSKWINCLLHQAAPLSAATHKEIRSPRMLEIDKPRHGFDVHVYGLGWERTTFRGNVVYKHNGATQNFGTNVLWMPDIKFSVITFANAVNTGSIVEETLTQQLIEDRLGVPTEERHDYSNEGRQQLEKAKRDFNNATNILYPNRAADPPSFQVNYDLMAGTYHDAGYGTYIFTVEESTSLGASDNGRKLQLVATREDTIVPTRLILRHVVGDYWVAYLEPVVGPPVSRSFQAARFVAGVDGRPAALEITWAQGDSLLSPIKVSFHRVG